MNYTTKKATGYFFLLLGFTPMLFVFVFMLKQQSIRHRMKHRLEEEILHTITIADNEVHWIKKGKELLIDGRMFDVESVKHEKGKTIVSGLFDDEETVLNKNFSEGWKKRVPQQNNVLAEVFQCLQGFYFSTPADLIIRQHKQQFTGMLSSPKLMSQFKLIITPPPQAA